MQPPIPTPDNIHRTLAGAIAHFIFTPLNVAFLTAAFFFWIHADYEDRLLQAIVRDNTTHLMSKQQRVIKLRDAVHRIVEARTTAGSIYSNPPASSVADFVRSSTDQQLMCPDGACASFAMVFVRTCQVAGFDARISHLMKGDSSAHMVGEVLLNDKWVYVDPQWNVCFHSSAESLASFDEISADWDTYLKQVDETTRNGYVSYGITSTSRQNTNWSKIPVIMPLAKSALDQTIGKVAADRISLRSFFLNSHRTFFILTIIALVAINGIRFYIWRRSRHWEHRSPETNDWKRSPRSGRLMRRRRSEEST